MLRNFEISFFPAEFLKVKEVFKLYFLRGKMNECEWKSIITSHQSCARLNRRGTLVPRDSELLVTRNYENIPYALHKNSFARDNFQLSCSRKSRWVGDPSRLTMGMKKAAQCSETDKHADQITSLFFYKGRLFSSANDGYIKVSVACVRLSENYFQLCNFKLTVKFRQLCQMNTISICRGSA